jgi:hypothetical protein
MVSRRAVRTGFSRFQGMGDAADQATIIDARVFQKMGL